MAKMPAIVAVHVTFAWPGTAFSVSSDSELATETSKLIVYVYARASRTLADPATLMPAGGGGDVVVGTPLEGPSIGPSPPGPWVANPVPAPRGPQPALARSATSAMATAKQL